MRILLDKDSSQSPPAARRSLQNPPSFPGLDVTSVHPNMFTPPPLETEDFVLHELFDYQATHQAEHPYCAWLDDSSSSDQAVEMTNLEFNRASHRAAALLSRDALDGEKVGLFALAHPVHYLAVFMGLLRLGVVVRLVFSFDRRSAMSM